MLWSIMSLADGYGSGKERETFSTGLSGERTGCLFLLLFSKK